MDNVVAHLGRKLGPTTEIERVELLVYRLRGTDVEQRESPFRIRHVNRLEMPVQNQDRRVDHDMAPGHFLAQLQGNPACPAVHTGTLLPENRPGRPIRMAPSMISTAC